MDMVNTKREVLAKGGREDLQVIWKVTAEAWDIDFERRVGEGGGGMVEN